jgi:hypothetical protein
MDRSARPNDHDSQHSGIAANEVVFEISNDAVGLSSVTLSWTCMLAGTSGSGSLVPEERAVNASLR